MDPNDLLNIANGAIAYQKQVDVAEYISWVDGIMLLNGNDLSQYYSEVEYLLWYILFNVIRL